MKCRRDVTPAVPTVVIRYNVHGLVKGVFCLVEELANYDGFRKRYTSVTTARESNPVLKKKARPCISKTLTRCERSEEEEKIASAIY